MEVESNKVIIYNLLTKFINLIEDLNKVKRIYIYIYIYNIAENKFDFLFYNILNFSIISKII